MHINLKDIVKYQLKMRVGVTLTVQSSTFSGGVNTSAIFLAYLLKDLGYSPIFVNNTTQEWFIDNPEIGQKFGCQTFSPTMEKFDLLFECGWHLSAADRAVVASKVIVVVRRPPLFTDLESTVYPMIHDAIRLGVDRTTNVAAIWCIGPCGDEDKQYMNLLYSGTPIHYLPQIWYPHIVDGFTTGRIPEWPHTAAAETATWDAHICENNQTITSSSVIPLTICRDLISERIKRSLGSGDAQPKFTWKAHCTDHLKGVKFFMDNIFASLFPAQHADNLVPRIQLPLLRLAKSFIIAHQRFYGVRAMYLDALWLGIPLVHNCEQLGRDIGYFYKDNEVCDAVAQIFKMAADYKAHTGFFAPDAATAHRKWVQQHYIPTDNITILQPYKEALTTVVASVAASIPISIVDLLTELNISSDRITGVFPEELAGRTEAFTTTHENLRKYRFARATTLTEVLTIKAAGCVPVFCGDVLPSEVNPAAVIHVKDPKDIADAVAAADATRRGWIAVYLQPLVTTNIQQDFSRTLAVHLINLDKRTDRLERFNKNHPDLEHVVRRFPAVNGRTLKLTPELCKLLANNKFGWKKGVVGCTLSHYNVWKQIVRDGSKFALCLEDDVVLKPGWREAINAAFEHGLPSDIDVLYLGGALPPNRAAMPACIAATSVPGVSRFIPNRVFVPTDAPAHVKTNYFHMCAYAYILTLEGARKLLNIVEKEGLTRVSDHMLCDNYEKLGLAVMHPAFAGCYQDDDPKYARADFNNYTREEKTDTDLWNDDVRFTEEEIAAAATAPEDDDNIVLPPELKNGMSHDEAFKVLQVHYGAKPWVLYSICRVLGLKVQALQIILRCMETSQPGTTKRITTCLKQLAHDIIENRTNLTGDALNLITNILVKYRLGGHVAEIADAIGLAIEAAGSKIPEVIV